MNVAQPELMVCLGISGLLLAAGVATMLLRRNAIGVLMGVELVLNSANINLVAFNRFLHADRTPLLSGQMMALFVMVLAAAEAAVALAIFLNFYAHSASVDVERADELKG